MKFSDKLIVKLKNLRLIKLAWISKDCKYKKFVCFWFGVFFFYFDFFRKNTIKP